MRELDRKYILQAQYLSCTDLREKGWHLYMYTREVLDSIFTEEYMRERAKNYSSIIR